MALTVVPERTKVLLKCLAKYLFLGYRAKRYFGKILLKKTFPIFPAITIRRIPSKAVPLWPDQLDGHHNVEFFFATLIIEAWSRFAFVKYLKVFRKVFRKVLHNYFTIGGTLRDTFSGYILIIEISVFTVWPLVDRNAALRSSMRAYGPRGTSGTGVSIRRATTKVVPWALCISSLWHRRFNN